MSAYDVNKNAQPENGAVILFRSRRRAATVVRVLTFSAATYLCWLSWAYVHSAPGVQRHHLEAAALLLAAISLTCFAVASPPQPEGAARVRRAPPLLIGVLAAASAGALYWPSLQVGMLSDDFVLRAWARAGEFISDTHEFVRPLPLMLWRVVYEFGGGSLTLHLISVFLHALNSAAVFMLARANGFGRGAAILSATVFLCWPTQVEAVTWNAAIYDVLVTSLILVSVLVISKGEGAHWRWIVALALGIAATFTKETGLFLPLFALIATPDLVRRRNGAFFLLILSLWCAGYGFWRVAVRADGRVRPNISRYLVKEQLSRTIAPLALPLSAATTDAAPITAFAFVFIVVGLGVGGIVLREQRSDVDGARIRGLLWTVTATTPAMGYLYIGPFLDGTRYLYLSAVGWSLFLAGSLDEIPHARRYLRIAPVALCALLLLLSIRESRALQFDWGRAAVARDGIIGLAVKAADEHHCRTATYSGSPARFRGAQLFLNGLDQAVAEVRSTRDSPAGAECSFGWSGSAFAPISIGPSRH